MKNGRPTKDDILAMESALTPTYGTWHTKIERAEQFYELNFKNELRLPTEFAKEGIVLPTARDFTDTFVDHIDIGNARVSVNKAGIYKKSEEEMETGRRLGQGVLHMTSQSTDISQWRVGGKHYANHGLSGILTQYDADMWPDKPIQKDDESEEAYAERMEIWRADTHLLSAPIVLQAIHPHNILMDPGNPRQFVIIRSTMLRIDAEKLYPWWKNPEGKCLTDEVEKLDYWDGVWHCPLVDREPILKIGRKGDTYWGVDKHRYRGIPLVLIESGLGNMSYQNKPEMRYVGILDYIFDLLISESRDYSISDVILSKTAWGGGFLENSGNVDVTVKTVEQGNFGTWQQLPPGIKPITVTPQVPPEALNNHLARTSYYLQAHAAPSSLRGMGEEGVRSGADRRLVISQAMARYVYANQAFANGAARVLTNCAKIAKYVIPGNINVWFKTPGDEFDYYTIDKDKLKEPFIFTVEFAPVSEDDEYKRHMDLEQLVASGIAPLPWARRQMSNMDATAVEREIDKQALKNDPGIIQMKSSYAQAQLAKAIQKRVDADQLAEGGMPPMQGNPLPNMGGIPNSPMGAPPQGNRLVPPVREITQPGSMQAIQQGQVAMMPPMPKLGMQGNGGGGNGVL